MRGAFRTGVAAVIFVSVFSLFVPGTSALAVPRPEAKCCAMMKMGGNHNNCGKEAPKSKPDRECCAACASGLTLSLTSARPFFYPAWKEKRFSGYLVDQRSRKDRPPVPPPRPLLI